MGKMGIGARGVSGHQKSKGSAMAASAASRPQGAQWKAVRKAQKQASPGSERDSERGAGSDRASNLGSGEAGGGVLAGGAADIACLQSSVAPCLPHRPVPGSARPLGPSGKHSEYFKQRVATELLGDEIKAPWDIDEERLFRRLAGILKAATTRTAPAEAATASSSDAALLPPPPVAVGSEPSSSHGGELWTTSPDAAADDVERLLVTMHQSITQNAQAVRRVLEAQQEAARQHVAAVTAVVMEQPPTDLPPPAV